MNSHSGSTQQRLPSPRPPDPWCHWSARVVGILILSLLLGAGAMLASSPRVLAQDTDPVPVDRMHDLGDAPDSSNHHGLDNTAYPSVLGKFPTVWEGEPPSGPLHRNISLFWLGDRVSAEVEADQLPDADGVTNILNNGANDVANRDRADDGWLNPDAPFINCQETRLKVRVAWNGPTDAARLLYINAWYDGNRDGDWDDVGACPDNLRSFEWIIQNATYNNPSFGPGNFVDIDLGTVLVHNLKENAPAWLRITLSERPVEEWDAPIPDGRGPPYPDHYALGETEDYLTGQPQEPPVVTIRKTANVTQVQPGGEIEYTVVVANSGGSPANGVTVIDPIPTGTTYVAGSATASAPTVDDSDPTQIKWSGNISAGGNVTITFKVKVNDNVDCGATIYNRAGLLDATGQLVQTAEAKVEVVCPQPPKITLTKKADPATVAPGGIITYEIVVTNSSSVNATGVSVFDPIPTGTTYVPGSATATAPAVSYNGGSNRIEWTGTVPANGSVTIQFQVRVNQDIACGSVIENVARARAPFLNEPLEVRAQTKIECPQAPKLDIVKRANPATTVPGGIIEYEITIYNGGNVPASVTMIDPIPAGTAYVAGSVNATAPTPGYDNVNNRIIWNGTVPALGSVTIKFRVQVNRDVECGSVIVNTATARGHNQVVESSASVKVECPQEPDLTIRKTANVSSVVPGGEIEYTIVIANSGSAPAIGVTMLDPIPGGTSYVTGTVSSTAPAAVYDPVNNRIKWVGDVPAGGSVTIKFRVKVSTDVECQSIIRNRAAIVRPSDLSVIQQAIAAVHIECPPQDVYMDFGDAPDSTFNHHGLDNTAYPGPGTLGRYPSVWEGTPAGEPSGPAHQMLYWYWLGELETREKDADLLPDGDGVTNILNNGTADVANRDRGDDGWLNPTVALEHCKTTTLRVRVSRSAAAPALNQLYLNVWFDGNRDGDWEDFGRCPQVTAVVQSYEWIVQNHVVNAGAIPVAGFVDLAVPTVAIHNLLAADAVDNTAWMRFTLSERPAVTPLAGGLPDGRGPDYPGRFRLGETEDYIHRHDLPGDPKLEIRKKADVSRVQPGGMVEYTIQVHNSGTGPATGVTVIDPIPAGTTYVAGSVTPTPDATYDAGNNWIKWTGNIPAGGTVTITFKVQVSPNAPCGTEIKNVAYIVLENGQRIPSDGVLVHVECPPQEAYTDLGDAPHSRSNHYGMDNTAYTGVLGRFPTVWETTPATEPSGPKHLQADHIWLGNRVTAEKDADLLPDMDPRTNILDNGAADVADNDRADDGWLNPDAPLDNCRETTLLVRVSRAAFPITVEKLYLNVWFDGNRDGDWQDTGECRSAAGVVARSFEWIVQDWTIAAASVPVGGFIDIKVPTVLVYNAKPDAAAWMRFTLSEQPAVRPTTGGLPDGRGPQQPAAFRLGETEDYLRPGKNQGEPGKIAIDKTATTLSSPVGLGDVINYSVYLTHSGGTAPATTVMTDVLPAEVILVSPPVVTELTPSAAPLVATFDGAVGPNGAVIWNGTLAPGAAIRIDFAVRVRYCPDNKIIRNVAVAQQTDGSLIRAQSDVEVECTNPEPEINLEKKILVTDGQTISEVNESPILGNNVLGYVLRLSSSDSMTRTVVISDDLPSGVIAISAGANFGVTTIENGGHRVKWTGNIGPDNSPAMIRIRIRLEREIKCDERLINVAHWFTRGFQGTSNQVTLYLACSDLGDAPDSTNHAGAGMTAYPATAARYPTVFGVAAPERGPKHLHPRPFHLGRGVTAEVEADQGFDQDGVNNIRPAANTPNLDRSDDGLLVRPNFNHCQLNRMQIRVSISPAALALFGQNKGYLNLWVDSNRDGDWADELGCSQVPGTNFTSALEHIVIDYAVDVATLGVGVHDLIVPTTGPVFFPTNGESPAWLRITLSEKASNKTLTATGPGHSTYGDGRGHNDPFRLGETEDYLIPGTVQQAQADVSVSKRGAIWPNYDPTTNQRRWMVGWIINYANAGPAAATNVHVVDTFAPPQTLVAEHSIPLVPHTQTGNTLDYNVGTLPAGGSGLVIIRTAVPWNTTPGTVLRNEVKISASNDNSAANNSSTATVTVPILPPVIVSPLAGTTCTGTVSVAGKAQPGVTVDLYADNVLAASVPTNASGDWSTTVTLADGNHTLHAIARMGALTSAPSPTVMIKVDSSLFWDPISLRFTDSSGQVIIPNGRLDESGWSIFLRPGHTYTVSLRVCCADPNAGVTLEIGPIAITLTDPDNDRIYTATFTTAADGRFTGAVRVCVTCNLIRRCSDGTVLIDPEGTVFNLLTGQPVDGADVACFQETTESTSSSPAFELWPAADFGQINEQTVGSDGYYSFFTPSGTYRVEVNKDGYQPHRSPDLVVTDSPVHYDVPLTPVVSEDADHVIAITESGFEPSILTVEPGDVIEWVNAGSDLHSTTTGNIQAANAAANENAWDSGLLATGESYKRILGTEGTYTYQDSANPDFTATIIVEEGVPAEPSKNVFLPLVSKR